ncbi:zinc finger protein 429 isoform X1 [Drosophila innubila]|uniref:zinc finger protein 429 isoform X1 n=2 Tax=Drosophila innubila TaxID=198719 RepID=UPI00148D6511|nr:zinc finger protein 429 isoform X1 [Drosophila innubila]
MLTFANISQLCRICLRHLRQINEQQQNFTTNSQQLLRNKASYNSKTLPDLAKMLSRFFAIDVFQQPDTFPQNVCALCYNAVEYFQQLCIVAEQSNEMLMRLTISLDVDEPEHPITAAVAGLDADADVDADTHLLPLVKEEPVEDEIQQQQQEYDSELDKDADADADDNTEDQEETSMNCEAADTSSVNKRKLLACQQCGKQVYKLPYLEAHIRSVHEGHPKPFLCRNCDKAFTRYEQLRSHMRNVHPTLAAATAMTNEELDLKCEQCDRKYSTKNALGEHLKRHAQQKPHICEHCGVAKVTRTELLTHLRIHNPDWEKFKCKQCPQLFRHKSAISRHVRVVHEGQRRFQCGHCHKRFGTHASQLRHERLHIETAF